MKRNIEPHQRFTGCYKKHGSSGLTPIHIENRKQKKVNKLWQKLSQQHNVKFKNYVYLREKEAYSNKWNVLVLYSSNSRLGLLNK